MKNKRVLLILVPLVLILLWLIIFTIDYVRYINNKTPIFSFKTTVIEEDDYKYTLYNCALYKVIKYGSLYGKNVIEFGSLFMKPNNDSLTKKEYDYINEYFKQQDLKEIKNDDEMCFVSSKVLNVIRGSRSYLKDVSIFVRGGCYYVSDKVIKLDSGYSIPYKVVLNNKEETKIELVKSPGDGTYYAKDMKKLFGKSSRIAIDHIDVNMLNNDIIDQVNEYFYPLKLVKE